MTMKKKIRYGIGGLLTVALLCAAAFALFRSHKVHWPEFPDRKDAPAAVADVLPDFSWRTGDVIPVTVYIREAPGTVCDLKSVVVKGDAQLRSFKTYTETQSNGTRLIRLDIELQAFVLKPVWNVTPFITYRAGEKQERTQLELPSFEIGSSNTYDHRKIERTLKDGRKIEMKDGHPKDQPTVYLVSYAWTTDVAVFTAALMAIAVAVWMIRTRPRSQKKTRSKPLVVDSTEWADTVADVNAAMQLLLNGDTQVATYVRVERGLRSLFRLDAVELPAIEAAADAGCNELCSLRHIVAYCHEVIYGKVEGGLSQEDIVKMSELLPEALAVAPRFKGMPTESGNENPFGELKP